MSGLEIAAGVPLEPAPGTRLPPATSDPLTALEAALRDALARPPCVIGFSGGRDSSTLLAAAARVARREGLEPPIALTQRFPAFPDTHEGDWQETVVRHLGLRDWVRLEWHDELDIVGPIARRALERHGPMYPHNAHFVIPLLEHTGGGTAVTGLDGDTLFGGWRWQWAAGSRHPRHLAVQLNRRAPEPVQRAVNRRRHPGPALSWLTPDARRLAEERRLRGLRLHPARFDGYVEWLAGRRYIELLQRQFDLFAADAQARIVHPFLDRRFLAALAKWGGANGGGGRTAMMSALFGGLLPERVLTRPTKAIFDGPYMGPHMRAFLDEWDGSGLPEDLVDADALRVELAKPVPVALLGQLVQWLWLTGRGTS